MKLTRGGGVCLWVCLNTLFKPLDASVDARSQRAADYYHEHVVYSLEA